MDEADLVCSRCDCRYPVRRGVARFNGDLNTQVTTSRSFGFQWRGFWRGMFDVEDVYGLALSDTREYFLRSLGLEAEALRSAKVLDAGTGSGRIPRALQGLGCQIFAVDIHEALEEIAARFEGTGGVQFVQCDLLRLPFPDNTFDVAWSSGVLHHTPSTRDAFLSVARTVKPGGRFFVWLYGTELHHYRLLRRLFPFAHRLPTQAVYFLSALLAAPLYVAFNVILAVLRRTRRGSPPPYRVVRFAIENLAPKTYRSILLNIFDQLHPPFQREHSVDEVRSWFKWAGFGDLVVTEATNAALRGTRYRDGANGPTKAQRE